VKEAFRKQNFRENSLAMIDQMNSIIREYLRQGLRLTARQLYYQFVSRDLVKNNARSYKNLTALLSDARYAGLVDWNAIEDRGRVAWTPSQWDDVAGLVESACASFRLKRWSGQANYVELWVEKQALAGVLEPMADEFTATLMVNKGYSSSSAMYEASKRFERQGLARNCVLLYLGDHDPSGEDMVRDIGDRLREFGAEVEVEKIALTMDQIREYEPPPNPAKTTDSRYDAYALEHGTESWEVDALPPDVLQALIRARFEELIDVPMMDAIKAKEDVLRDRLRDAAAEIDEEVE